MRTSAIAPMLLVTLLLPAGARGEEPPASEPEAAPPAAPPDLSVKPLPPLDFDLLEEKPGERRADEALEAAVARRRKLLQAHQAAGLAAWAVMATTVVVGELNYRDLYTSGDFTLRYRSTHRALGYATASTYAFAGLLAALAPEPYPKRLRLDTATIHKTSMAVTGVGIVAQVTLGILTRNHAGRLDQRDLANAHRAVGIGTFAAMTIGAVTLVF